MTQDAYAAAQVSAGRLAALSGRDQHDVAVVLGSGWASAADGLTEQQGRGDDWTEERSEEGGLGGVGRRLKSPRWRANQPAPTEPNPLSVDFSVADLGGFPQPSVAGHVGAGRSLLIGSLRVLVYLGRTHLYEGHSADAVVHGVRTAAAAGCKVIVLTNAAGGINPSYQVGQPVLLSDHLNLTGRSPLTGPEPPAGYDSRFVDLSHVYSPRLRALALSADPSLAEGVYAALPGPHYETPAEIRMLAAVGADMVGMSTALEAIAARHLGMEVLGISLITNPAAGLAFTAPASTAEELEGPSAQANTAGLDHADVLSTGRAAAGRVGALLAQILPGALM